MVERELGRGGMATVFLATDVRHDRKVAIKVLRRDPLIADFGVARAVERSVDSGSVTTAGVTVGTPHYMSPEQAAGETELDGRTDIFALGSVLYEMLAGTSPFAAPTAQAVIARVMADVPRPLATVRRTVPVRVDSAVRRALAKVPGDRFTTAADFAAALDPSAPTDTASSGAAGVDARRPSHLVSGVRRAWARHLRHERGRKRFAVAALRRERRDGVPIVEFGWEIGDRPPRRDGRAGGRARVRPVAGGCVAERQCGGAQQRLRVHSRSWLRRPTSDSLPFRPMDVGSPTSRTSPASTRSSCAASATRAGRWPISAGGGLEPRWSRDGKELFYRSGQALVSVPVQSSPSFAVTGPRTTLFRLADPPSVFGPNYDVAPNGRGFVSRWRPDPDIVPVLLNWFSAWK